MNVRANDHSNLQTAFLRKAIITHAVCVLVCGAFSIVDSRSLPLSPTDPLVRGAMYSLFNLGLIGSLLCPVTIACSLMKSGPSRRTVWAIVAEGTICFGQLFALLPLVQ